ncbi:MAG: uncharacterized SAM-binding protein YcdF (DUF218 family) [Saprospiraceae bacterium]|jgi:uncharacterized SAM-binding protein YcdF (DUF218 family)
MVTFDSNLINSQVKLLIICVIINLHYMFFILSKLLLFVLNPIVWVTATLLFALLSKNTLKRKRLLFSSLLIVYIFGNSFLVDEVYRQWEIEAIELNESNHYDYGIVLSGMTVWDTELNRVNFHGNVDRLLQALPLHQNGIIDSLILTGGDGSAFQDQKKESDVLFEYLNKIGFSTQKLIIEAESKNTNENASFTLKELQERGVDLKAKKVLLITSASHMRRSLACFEKHGVTCTPYVTNRLSGPRKFVFDHLVIPNPGALHAWNNFLHEVVGFVIYSIMGYI